MAKRYAKYDSIREGYFKPECTMGSHHCMVVVQKNSKIVIGSVAGKVTLKPGDTLGYDCGEVWLVPSPESYKDPIRKILAENHVSQKTLIYSNEPIKYLASWEENHDCYDNSTGEEATILGHFENKNEREPFAYWENVTILGGEVVIIKKVVSNDPTNIRRRIIARVVVRSTAQKETVMKFLDNELKYCYLETLEGVEITRLNRYRF